MKKYLSFFLSVCFILLLTACGSVPADSMTTDPQAAAPTDTDAAQSAENTDTETTQQSAAAVVYFSGTGNTKAVAQTIADTLQAELFEIQPQEPYSADDLNYNNDDCRANREMNDASSRPAIANDLQAVQTYDTIFVGYPIWWGTAPRIIQTFFDTYDCSSKTVYTFCTSGGSDIAQSIRDLQQAYPSIHVVSGRRFAGNSQSDITAWLNGLQ